MQSKSKKRDKYNKAAADAGAVLGVSKRPKGADLKPVSAAVAEVRDGSAFLSTREQAPSWSLDVIAKNRLTHRDVSEGGDTSNSENDQKRQGEDAFKNAVWNVADAVIAQDLKADMVSLPAVFLPFLLLRAQQHVPTNAPNFPVLQSEDTAKKHAALKEGVRGLSSVLMGKLGAVSALKAPTDASSHFNEADLVLVTDMAGHLDKEIRSLKAARTRRIKKSGMMDVDKEFNGANETKFDFLDGMVTRWKSLKSKLKNAKEIPHDLPNGIKEILSMLPKESSLNLENIDESVVKDNHAAPLLLKSRRSHSPRSPG